MFISIVDQFEPPVRLLDKPFRMAVSDFFKGGIGSSSGVSVAGRIDAGHVQVGEQIVAIPGGEIGVIKSKVSLILLFYLLQELTIQFYSHAG
jgi:elongation factor 1 alpha-like protein